MIVIRTAEDMARALDSPLDPALQIALQGHATRLAEWDLLDLAVLIIVQPSDTLDALESVYGERLVDASTFVIVPELVSRHCDWIELVFILSDDGFGLVLFVSLERGADPFLETACRHALRHSTSRIGE